MGFDSKLVTLYFLGASSVVTPDVAVFKMLISHAGVDSSSSFFGVQSNSRQHLANSNEIGFIICFREEKRGDGKGCSAPIW